MRRSAGFDIADHIVSYYQGEDYIKQVMADFADYIKQETLSREINDGVPEEGVFSERQKISGYDILLGVKKLG
jgi:isoleucyl-tRNA synthetase